MTPIEVIDFALSPSIMSRYVMELRDTSIHGDPMRFRLNLKRIAQIMAYEISRRLKYKEVEIATPLAPAKALTPEKDIVIATIMRAGIPFHEGFLSYFDYAGNAFVSAFRKYRPDSDEFDVVVEYLASPRIEGKTLLIVDPMLATGSSLELAYKALLTKGEPEHIHIACAIASEAGIEYCRSFLPSDKTTIWAAAVDPDLNSHSYIVPGLGDAGDLAYGPKE